MIPYLIANIVIIAVLGLLARSGSKYEKQVYSFNYTTRDIVIIAVIAAIAAVVNTGTSILWNMANSTLGPLGGALLQGTFMLSYVLTMWLVRKPGAALAVGMIEATIGILLGNPSGIGTLGWGISEGLAIEAVMALVNYMKFDLITALCAGAAASQFGTVWTAILFGWDPKLSRDVWFAIPVNLVSGAIFSGLIAYLLARGIHKTGLVRSATP